MREKLTQEQRLDYLVEEFKTDSVEYKNLQTPEDTDGKRRVLRSLMNIRMPKKLSDEVLNTIFRKCCQIVVISTLKPQKPLKLAAFGLITSIPTRLIPSQCVDKHGIYMTIIICIFTFHTAFLVYQKLQYQIRIN